MHGVTTNPTILERAGRMVADIPELYARWAREGTPVLLTAVFTPAQALAAASCGIRYIAAYLGRMRDAGFDAVVETAHAGRVRRPADRGAGRETSDGRGVRGLSRPV